MRNQSGGRWRLQWTEAGGRPLGKDVSPPSRGNGILAIVPVIDGYSNNDLSVFCVDCWRQLAKAGEQPQRILDLEDPDDPKNNFWIVDNCQLCGVEVKSLSSRELD